ncbi:hypothetical protein HOP50_06g44990 [Chloropicon primus]|uniref:Uncharacterized protein n=1 Tax=Chloropicon primus TaxID=1764295 RepID=A0A5B8MMS1_9CHLO|nr:hypothetical protein A3770_06p44760 [Chloropicon primus]UPR01178.1 hypothetical protein HOP50_06g44990 [Chloropicon primus]|eukprot:QDZ21958.1 hypothetical protein A3770_06p44760 [Chloropicon primus]
MLHWLEVSRPSLPKAKTKLTGNTGSADKLPEIAQQQSKSKARREWNSRLPVENGNKTSKLDAKKTKYGGLPPQTKERKASEKKGKADAELDATVKFLELHLAALQSKHNALRRLCREKKHLLSKSMDKCNILRRENSSAQNLLHHNNTLKEKLGGCEEKNYNLEDFQREFSHCDNLRPVVSLSSVSSLASFEDESYVHQLEETLKRVNIGKMKEGGIELSLAHMLRRCKQAHTTSSASAENKRSDLFVTCKKFEKHQHKTLKAKHLKKVAFEQKSNFEQYVNNNRSIWMKKINHRRNHVNKIRQARERLKRKQASKKGGGKEASGSAISSVVADFEFNVIKSRFEKLQSAIGTTDLSFLANTICETIQGTSNLNGKVSYLQEKLEQKNVLLKEAKTQMNSLQIHGSTDFTGTYKKVETLEEELQNKLHGLKVANQKESEAQKLISLCSNYFSKLTHQLQPFKVEATNQSIAENVEGNEVETIPEILRTLQTCESKLDLLCRLEQHNFNMNEVVNAQQQEETAQQVRLAARRDSTFVPHNENPAHHGKRLSTTTY